MKLFENIKNWFVGDKEIATDQDVSELKDIIKNVLGLFVVVKTAKKDEKISVIEWGQIAKATLPIINNARKYKLIKAQILDFKTPEGIELINYATELGILPNKAAFVVEKAIDAIESTLINYNSNIKPIIELIKNKKV